MSKRYFLLGLPIFGNNTHNTNRLKLICAIMVTSKKIHRTPFWYNALLACIKPLYRLKIKKKSGHLDDFDDEIIERFGPFQPPKNTNVIWFHVVSVGETNAAQPLIEHYLKLGHPVLVTNTTRTGQARSKSLFLERYPNLFQAVFLPTDQIELVNQFIGMYQPKILLLMETELWPNLLSCIDQKGIPQLLLNARLSEKSAKGYGKFKSLTLPMLTQLNMIATQDQASLERFAELGKNRSEMQNLGNVKFDITAPQVLLDQAKLLQDSWQLSQRQIMLIASTHDPEEQQIISALADHLKKDPTLLCIVVPRHPERFDQVALEIEQLGLAYQRRSLKQTITPNTQVYLADTMGELWLWCALSDVVYVGGSLNEPGGGHNILEPIALNMPTILGKNYFNFQTIVDEFLAVKGIVVVQDAEQASRTMLSILNGESEKNELIQNARQVFAQNKGSVDRHLALIHQFLERES